MPVALMVMWLNGWKPLILSHHAANFGGFKYCGSGDNTFLICHKISQCHIVKGSFNPPKSGCHRHCGTGNAFNLSRDVRPCDRKVMWLYGWELLIISLSHGLLICHRTSHDHVVVKGVFFYSGWKSLIVSPNLTNSGDVRPCSSGDIIDLICCMTSQDYMIKESYRPARLGGHRHYGSWDKFLINLVISRDHIIKRS